MAHPVAGPEAVTDAQVAAYRAAHPELRAGAPDAVVRALVTLASFAPLDTRRVTGE